MNGSKTSARVMVRMRMVVWRKHESGREDGGVKKVRGWQGVRDLETCII